MPATEPLSDTFGYGLASARPPAGINGRAYYASDTQVLSRDNGTAWVTLALAVSGGVVDPTTTAGDMIVREASTNFATPANGASASATIGDYAGSPPNAIDGSDTTSWISGVGGVPGNSLIINLGVARSIAGARIVLNGGDPMTFVIEWSVDGSAPWTVVDTAGGGGGTIVRSFTATSARYWRMRATGGGTGNNHFYIYTLELLGAPQLVRLPTTPFGRSILDDLDAAAGRATLGISLVPTDHGGLTGLADDDHPQYLLKTAMAAVGDMVYLQATVNLATAAQGASATASSTISPYFPSNLLDENQSTMWHPNTGASGSYATIDLGQVRTIGSWRIIMSTAPQEIPTSWILQYSTDGSAFTTIDTVAGGAGGDKGVRAITPQTARYWRIVSSGAVSWDPRVDDVYLFSASPTVAATPSSAFGRSLLPVADAAAARTVLGITGGGGGGGGGALVYVGETVLAADAADITLTGIPTTFKDLVVVYKLRSAKAAIPEDYEFRVGSGSIDTAAHYAYWFTYGGSSASNGGGNNATFGYVGVGPAAASAAGVFLTGELHFIDYASTVHQKQIQSRSSYYDNNVSVYLTHGATVWTELTAIDQVRLFAANGNLKAGSSIVVYGRAAGYPPGYELDYAQVTAGPIIPTATTEPTANVVVSGNAVTYDGVTTVMVDFFVCDARAPNDAAGRFMYFVLFDGGSSIGLWGFKRTSATGNDESPVRLSRRLTPSAGAHTYSVRAYISGGINANISVGTGVPGDNVPGFIRITKV